jgi:tryptophan synthase alpha chain
VSGRISRAFAKASREERAALVVFVEAGDPSLEATERLLPALVEAGADVIELGVPFSDPIADGPVIQRASERALAGGTTLSSVLELVGRLRAAGLDAPVVLFGYANPVLAMGEAVFAAKAAEAGVDGTLVTDLPPEEGASFAAMLRAARLDPVFLLAPTSPSRRAKVVRRLSRGFVYVVSRPGVTGVRSDVPEGLADLVARVRTGVGRLPVAVGFGISTPAQVAAVARLADGVVVGSAVAARLVGPGPGGAPPAPPAAGLVRELALATRR